MPFHTELNGIDLGMSELDLLDFLTSPDLPVAKHGLKRRDADLDPLMLAAVYSSGPQVTRNHYAHDFFPAVGDPRAEGAYDWTKWQPETTSTVGQKQQRRPRLKYVSRQEPRSQRIKREGTALDEEPKTEKHAPAATETSVQPPFPAPATSALAASPESAKPPLQVKCMARTRVPTPHGPVFLHIYHNNHDSKEHLAIVVDPAQLSETSQTFAPPIRSQSLDAVWSEDETEMDRITRGAYVGRLSQHSQIPSTPSQAKPTITTDSIPSPLIRVHSECFTGETIGSMRCDCGEQLDEAIRLISQPIALPPTSATADMTTIPGRGAVVYLRQEGRGIGLLSKIRAYNLQDLGHDTVTANLMLGHGADERGYEIAAAILHDLGLGSETGEGVRVLTNNPDKMQALTKEGIIVVERVPMVPRSWACRQHDAAHANKPAEPEMSPKRSAGATMIGGGAVYGEDLDKYLRTKVLRMGHMLPLIATGDEDED
ncbi:GTP cyclohydrolase II [Phanerochaete sordida]|uniref:GTP cyclohydrolase II n=1 Tax=Phanerochaete sordida TaxID=48140 RepID=A0A9P3L6T6_9APHY|nr:GTP cyclohydrolase II [Phanerochaete sordida]